jgi:hypothetical protein
MQMFFAEEAEICRRKALAYLGKPEAAFLMRVAKEFDRLEAERREGRRERPLAQGSGTA